MENAQIQILQDCIAEPDAKVALCHSGCHQRGGVERVILQGAKYLKETCDVSVVARDLPAMKDVPEGVKMFRLPYPELPFGLGLRGTRRHCTRLVRQNRFDVVAGFGVQAPENSVVWIQSVHAAWWDQSRQNRRGILRLKQAANPLHHIVLSMEGELLRERAYKRLIALTPSVLGDLQRFYGVPSEDVDILPNGYKSDEFHVGLRELYRLEKRREIGVPLDAWVVLFVANEWERKGLLPLMEAIAALDDANIHLVAVGRLPQSMVQRKAADLGLLGRVHMVSSTSSVNRWFGMADVFALPTVYEAWGMVVIEAMASGLPVLTSSLAGASEAVEIGKNGFLLKEPRSVEEIVDGMEKLRKGVLWDSNFISKSVHKYEWNVIFKKYKSILMRSM